MIDELELRQQIAKALGDSISLDDLYGWLMAKSWNMHSDSELGAVALAAAVELLFFERSSGDLDDVAVRDKLVSLLNDIVVRSPVYAGRRTHFASSSVSALRPVPKNVAA